MKHSRLRVILEIILAVAAVGILYCLLQTHAPKILTLLESGNAEQIDDYLMQYGTGGKLLLVLLQVIETVSIVLPAVPVYICSGIMFGKLPGVAVCYSVNLVLNLLIFLAARRFRKSLHPSYDVGKQEFLGQMVDRAKHLDRVVIAMCLLPVVPNGMIPYMSAQTKITVPEFMKALAIGSLPAIALYVCGGDLLVSESYKLVAPLIAVLVILAAMAFLFRKQLVSKLEPKIMAFIEG